MASVRFIDVQSRPTEFLEFTSLPLDEFHQLVPPFEAAFQAHMAMCRLDRKPPHRSPDCRVQNTTWKVIREIWGAQKVLFFEINRLWKRP